MKYFILFACILFFPKVVCAQVLSGHYLVQKFKGIGEDEKLTQKAKNVDIYDYKYSKNKSIIELLNPSGNQIDTIKKIHKDYGFKYETVENSISFSKSITVKDLQKNTYEKLWIIDGIEKYSKNPCPKLNWVITDEMKEINGFLCSKATVVYTVQGITLQYSAWFSDKIPVSDGPFEYGGLPGFIFEFSVNDLFICKFINFKYDAKKTIEIEAIKN